MAIVDAAYEKWKKDFEAECPGLFKEGVLTGPETALRRDLMRTAYMAGKKAARQPVGQEPAFFVNRWEMEHGTASGLVAMRTGKHLGIRDFFTVPLYAAPTAQCAGEPVAWMTHHDEPMLFPTAAEAAAYCEDDEQPVPLFRSPAQAVDLEQFHALAEFGEEFAFSAEKQPQSRVIYAQARRLLALIDSKAVGK